MKITKPFVALLVPTINVVLLSFTTLVSAQSNSNLEEILVTAQKRVQSVQDIPVAVTAYSGEDLKEFGITDMFDLQNTAPGLTVSHNQTATSSNFSIRGIGTSGNNFGLESSVGLYVDGVYRARQSSMINELADVERIEVIRGPQGTLFGRNTPSGAILIESVKPSHEESGYIDVVVGDYGLFSLNGAVGGSLVEDVWAWRTTVFNTQRDGFADVVGIDDEVLNDRDRQGGRFQLLYTPNDDFSARLIADFSELDEVCCTAGTKKNNFQSFNGQLGTDSLLTLLGGNIIRESRVEEFEMSLNQLPRSTNEDKGLSLALDWGLAGGTLTSITAYRDFETVDYIDGDFSNVDLFSRTNQAEQSSFSQEIRFSKETEKMDYVVGAYYFTQDMETYTETIMGSMFNPFLLIGSGATLAPLFAQYNQLDAFLGGALPPISQNPLPFGSSARNFMEQSHEAYALFGQLDYDLSDELQLTFGLRYTEESKDLVGRFEQDNVGPALNPADPFSLTTFGYPGWGYAGILAEIAERLPINETLDDDQVTGTVKLTWSPNEDTIYFASYGTGYKSGGTNTDRINPTFSTLFDAETSEAFEFGMKKDFPDQNFRLNATLHMTTTEDLQTNSFAGSGYNLINAGEVEAKGAEIEFWWYPTDTLKLSGAFVYNDAEYKKFDGANCQIANFFHNGLQGIDPGAPRNASGLPILTNGCSRTGEGIQNNPQEVIILSVTKSFILGNNEAYVHADYNHRADQLHDGNNDPLKSQNSYGLLNLKVGMYFDDGNSELSLWARNALDEYYFHQAFDAPLQDGKVNVYPGEPRMVGINYRKNFNW